MTDNTVAITGMGLVSSLGLDVDANWTRLQARETGIHETPRGAAPASYRYRGRIRGFEPPGDIPRPLMSQLRFLNRGSLLGLAAAREAMTAAHAADLPYAPRRRALYIGASDTTSVGYPYMYPATREATDGRWQGVDRARLNQAALDKVNPFFSAGVAEQQPVQFPLGLSRFRRPQHLHGDPFPLRFQRRRTGLPCDQTG